MKVFGPCLECPHIDGMVCNSTCDSWRFRVELERRSDWAVMAIGFLLLAICGGVWYALHLGLS